MENLYEYTRFMHKIEKYSPTLNRRSEKSKQ